MAPRPLIFISAVSKELKSARQLVSNTLQFLGYEPVWQDVFGTEQGDLREMLRKKIDDCAGVVQLVGKRYGAEPPVPDTQFGRVSYTQYEALYARQCKKKVWFLFLDNDFPVDTCPEEPPELRELQEEYRRRLKSESLLYHPLSSLESLEASVLKLRNQLAETREKFKRLVRMVIILLVVITGVVLWLEHGQQEERAQIAAQNQQLAQANQRLNELLQKFPETHAQIRDELPNATPAEVDRQTYNTLAKKPGIDSATLQTELSERARQIQQDTNATPFQKANAAFVNTNYAEAARLAMVAADEAQNATPPNINAAVNALKLAGDSDYNAGNYGASIADYTKALELNPDDHEACSSRGYAKLKKGDYDGAIADSTKAIELQPDYAVAYNTRGFAKLNKTDYDGAIVDETKAIALKPDFATAYNNRGLAKDRIGDHDGAIADETKAIELEPTDVNAYYLRGYARFSESNYDGAIADQSEVIALNPDYTRAYNSRGLAKDHRGDHDGAIADETKAIELEPDNEIGYNIRGYAKLNKGDYDGAIADETIAIEMKRDDANAYKNRGNAEFSKGDYRGAMDDLQKAIQINASLQSELLPLIGQAKAKLRP